MVASGRYGALAARQDVVWSVDDREREERRSGR